MTYIEVAPYRISTNLHTLNCCPALRGVLLCRSIHTSPGVFGYFPEINRMNRYWMQVRDPPSYSAVILACTSLIFSTPRDATSWWRDFVPHMRRTLYACMCTPCSLRPHVYYVGVPSTLPLTQSHCSCSSLTPLPLCSVCLWQVVYDGPAVVGCIDGWAARGVIQPLVDAVMAQVHKTFPPQPIPIRLW